MHEGIVELHDFVEDGDYFYMVLSIAMEANSGISKLPNTTKSSRLKNHTISQSGDSWARGPSQARLSSIRPQNVLVKTVNNEKVQMM